MGDPDALIRKGDVLKRIQAHVEYAESYNAYAAYAGGIRRDEALLLLAEVGRIDEVDLADLESSGVKGVVGDYGEYSGKDKCRIYRCHSCEADWVSNLKPDFCPHCGIKFTEVV